MPGPTPPSYSQQEWQDNNPLYPLSALRMKHIEAGLSAEEAFTKAVEEYITSGEGLPASVVSSSANPASAGLIPISTGSTSVAIGFAESPYIVVNGNTNAAITAAIEALPTVVDPLLGSIKAGTVILPPRVYTFTGAVQHPSYVRIDGLRRAILSRGGGYTGLFFTSEAAITQFALDGCIWDNGGTANMMWQFPVGCSAFDQEWARYQDFNGEVGKFAGNPAEGGATLNSDITLQDIRLYASGAPSNIAGLVIDDAADVQVSNIKCLLASGATYTVGAIKVETTSHFTGLSRNINIEDIEAEKPNASVVLVRPNGESKMEDISIKGIRGQELASEAIPKGLVVVGEQVGGTPGSTSTHGIRVEDIEGRDWWGKLVWIGGNGDCTDFTVSGVRGDCATLSTGKPDTTRESSGLTIVGAQHGEINGVVMRNTGYGGLRLIAGTYQGCAHIDAAGIDIKNCVQNPSLPGGTWHECGIMLDKGCSDIYIEGRSVDNYSAANPGGGEAGAGVGCTIGETTQANKIRLLVTCTDTREPKLQDVGVRIGNSGADANQPNEWDILPGSDLTGNKTAPIYGIPGSAQAYASTDHGHRLTRVRGAGVADLFAGSAANALTATKPAGADNSAKIPTTKWVRSLAGSLSSRLEAANAARNILTETLPIDLISTNTVNLATKELLAALVGFEAGDIVHGIAFEAKIEALTITYARAGLFTTGGVLLAKSADKSGTIGASGLKEWALETPFEITSVGGYYLGLLCVFTAGKIEPYRGVTKALLSVGINGGAKPVVKQTAQAALPEPATFAGGESVPWLAAY
jgi:hypothetical protein